MSRKTKEVEFEKSLVQLEKIVQALENSTLPLDESLKKFEEGVRLTREMQSYLKDAEKRVEILSAIPTKKPDGDSEDEA